MLAARAAAQAPPAAPASAPNPKQPYGGLVPTQPKGTRAYTDAAAYNQHLNQHQSYTAQAASQAAQQPIRNPYITPPQSQQPQQQQPPPPQSVPTQVYERNDYAPSSAGPDVSHRLQHQSSSGALASNSYSQQPPLVSHQSSYANPNPPSNSYYPQSRARANTINQMDNTIPPQIARIATLGMEVAGIKRNTLTPVLNREEAIKEWERRASGQRVPPGPAYPQLEYLQQQAELASNNWNGASSSSSSRRYHPSSSLQHFQTPPSALTVDSSSGKHHRELSNSTGMRDVNMGSLSSSRSTTTGYDQTPHANLPPAPPQAYQAGSSSARYANTSQPPPLQQSSSYQSSSGTNVPYDAYDHRDGLGTLYTPMQPSLVSSNSGGQQQSGQYSSGSNGNAMANASSFYGGGVVPASSQQQQQSMLGLSTSQQRQQPPANQQSTSQTHHSDPWAR